MVQPFGTVQPPDHEYSCSDFHEYVFTDVGGDMERVDYKLRLHMSALMDPNTNDDDWKILADKLQLTKLVPFLQNSRSPALALIDNYEVCKRHEICQLNRSIFEERFKKYIYKIGICQLELAHAFASLMFGQLDKRNQSNKVLE